MMMSDVIWNRIPAIISFPDTTGYTETYGFAGTSGRVNLEGQYFIPANTPSKTLFIFMHPSSTLNLMPMPAALAASGLHVLCAASRYPKNDSSLIMEKVVIDLGAWIREAREQKGYETIVLVGWSGGGSLSLFYQAQAEKPTIKTTPAGDVVDLSKADLPPADGVIFIAAHLSRAETLTEWLDPSVLDESDPDRRDVALDIYDESCPSKPPFDADFVARFRAAQRARSRKITNWCLERLDDLRRRKGPEIERAFIVHRTMCDVRWIDAAVDPNGRKPNWCYLGDPRTVNVAPVGLARYTSLRSWLSQWSYDASQAKAVINAPLVSRTPVLQIENLADDAVPATHNPAVNRLLGTPDKSHVRIDKATHYYVGQPEQLNECIRTVIGWCDRHGFLR
jgi:pimeloyl-ACP methyl ester carboxylesterase